MTPTADDERPRYLGDENFNQHIIAGLHRLFPELDIIAFGESGLPEGLPDPELIEATARLGRILLSHDKRTMPGHFSAVLTRWLPLGQHLPGVFILQDDAPISEAIEQLALIWGASTADEWHDRIVYLPE